MFSVVDSDGVPQEIPERDAVPTIELKFSAFEGCDNLFQDLCILVGCFLFFRHGCVPFIKKAPVDCSQGADLLCCGCTDELQAHYGGLWRRDS